MKVRVRKYKPCLKMRQVIKFYYCNHRLLIFGLLLLAGSTVLAGRAYSAVNSTIDNLTSMGSQKAAFPDLASRFAFEQQSERERKLAELMSSAGETITKQASQLGESQSAKAWLIDRFSHQLASSVTGQGEALLSNFGRANLSINPDVDTNLAGSHGGVFTSLRNDPKHLLFSEVDLDQSSPYTRASIGLGQRWQFNHWLFGFNTFVDHLFQVDQNQATFGSELWSDYLHLSANYYNPIEPQESQYSATQQVNRGYDINTEGFLPFYRQLGLKLKWQQFLNQPGSEAASENWGHASRSVQLAVIYHPIPLLTFSVSHQQISSGASQNTLGLTLSLNLGQSVQKQLSVNSAEALDSFCPDRYARVQRK